MRAKMQKASCFGILMICLILFISCNNVLEPEEEETVIVEECSLTNINNNSLDISITDDGIIFFNGLEKQDDVDKKNNIRTLMEKYESDIDYDLISLYKDFTGNQNVPEDILSMNEKIKLIIQNNIDNQDDCLENEALSQTDDETAVTTKVGSSKDMYKADLYSTDSFVKACGSYQHCLPRRTGYLKYQEKGHSTISVCFPYRGSVYHKVRYRTGSWKAGPSNVVPEGYLSFLSCYTGIIRNYVKYEVMESEGDGFHFACEF